MDNTQTNNSGDYKNDETSGQEYSPYQQGSGENAQKRIRFNMIPTKIKEKSIKIKQKINIILNTLSLRSQSIKIRIKSMMIHIKTLLESTKSRIKSIQIKNLFELTESIIKSTMIKLKEFSIKLNHLSKILYMKLNTLFVKFKKQALNFLKDTWRKIKNIKLEDIKELYFKLKNVKVKDLSIKLKNLYFIFCFQISISFSKKTYKIRRMLVSFRLYLVPRLIKFANLLKEFKEDFKGNIDADRELLEKLIKNIQIQISKKAKKIFKNKKQAFIKLLLEIKDLQIKELLNEIGSLSLKEIFYKVKNFLIRNILLLVKISRISIEKTLLLIKNFKENFYKTKQLLSFFIIKNLSRGQKLEFVKSFYMKAKKQRLIEYLKYFKLKFSMQKVLYLPYLKLKTQYIKFKKRLIVFFIKNKINFKEKRRYYIIKLKKKLNYQISNSKRIQHFIIKFNKAKLLIFNLPTNFENFIITVRYNHELATEYAKFFKEFAKRILFVIAMYSLPLLILTKLFYGNILVLVRGGNTRFDGLIPEKHLSLLISDKKILSDYIPLKFVPKILQSNAIDFYIFLTYYTLFGTSKFPLNKELVYHGIVCVAHLVVYASTGLIMSILQNFTDCYTVIVSTRVRYFISKKFGRFFKNKQLEQKASKIILLKQALSEDPTSPLSELSQYGIAGLDKIISNVPRSSETFFTTYLLTPISLYVLITLLYNCCYYIRYNKRPFIPVMTNFAKRITPNVKKDE